MSSEGKGLGKQDTLSDDPAGASDGTGNCQLCARPVCQAGLFQQMLLEERFSQEGRLLE